MADQPGAVADSPSAPFTLDTLSPADRASWQLTGEYPDLKADLDAPAASSAAVDDASSPSTEGVPPASEPGTPTKKKGAEARKAELGAEIQALLEKRAALQRELASPAAPSVPDVPPAASSPATQGSSTKPSWTQFESQIGTTYSSWADAQDAYADARDAWKDQQTQQAQAVQTLKSHAETVYRTGGERIAAHVATHPEFWAGISPEVASLEPLSVARAKSPTVERTPSHDIAEVVVTSEFTPVWMQLLSERPDILQALQASPNPEALYRAMGRIEATFAQPSAPESSPAARLSSAPAPPTTLGSKPSSPGDPVVDASARGDFRSFRSAANAADAGHR